MIRSSSASGTGEPGADTVLTRPVLIVIGGLPASGKSSVAVAYATRTRTPYLRVDHIEQALVDSSELSHPIGAAGYVISYRLAAEQLAIGLDVIAECVNPIDLTREAWRAVAIEAVAGLVELEMICSDAGEHRRRVEQRPSDVAGLTKPGWLQVIEREYEPWTRAHLVIDSAMVSVPDAAGKIGVAVATARARARAE